MNIFSRLLEIIFQNALLRLIFWFLLGAIFAILLINIFKTHPQGSGPQKAVLMLVKKIDPDKLPRS
jgi:hypothetical protein